MGTADVKRRLENLIAEAFPASETHLKPGFGADRVSGWIIWNGFVGMDQIDRQRRLREALDRLEPEARQEVGPILTMTSEEASDDEEVA